MREHFYECMRRIKPALHLLHKHIIQNFNTVLSLFSDNKKESDTNEEKIIYTLSDFIIKAQALDNYSDDQMHMGDKKLNPNEQQEFMSDIFTVVANGKSKNYDCIQVIIYLEHTVIQIKTTDIDIAGRNAPVIIYFNQNLISNFDHENFLKKIEKLFQLIERNPIDCAKTGLEDFFKNYRS